MQIDLKVAEVKELLREIQDNRNLATVATVLRAALDERGPFTADEVTVTQILLSGWLEGKPTWLVDGPRRETAKRHVQGMLEKLEVLGSQLRK